MRQSKLRNRRSFYPIYKNYESNIELKGQEALYNIRLNKGAAIEHKEHPEFTYDEAALIARDHLKENPKYYDLNKS